jgi:hypothetical protein
LRRHLNFIGDGSARGRARLAAVEAETLTLGERESVMGWGERGRGEEKQGGCRRDVCDSRGFGVMVLPPSARAEAIRSGLRFHKEVAQAFLHEIGKVGKAVSVIVAKG